MARWSPCKRNEFINKLRKLGFAGPFSGTRHQFMNYQDHRLAIPANKEFSVPQLKMLLREVELIVEQKITLELWNSLS